MSIYETLKQDHRAVERLFDRIEKAKDPDERFSLFISLKDELLFHAKAEEKVFYSQLGGDETEELIEHARSEHEAVESVLARLQDMEPDDDAFLETIEELRSMVEDHVEEEEEELFEQAREILGDDDDDAIEARFTAEKTRLMEQGLEPVTA